MNDLEKQIASAVQKERGRVLAEIERFERSVVPTMYSHIFFDATSRIRAQITKQEGESDIEKKTAAGEDWRRSQSKQEGCCSFCGTWTREKGFRCGDSTCDCHQERSYDRLSKHATEMADKFREQEDRKLDAFLTPKQEGCYCGSEAKGYCTVAGATCGCPCHQEDK